LVSTKGVISPLGKLALSLKARNIVTPQPLQPFPGGDELSSEELQLLIFFFDLLELWDRKARLRKCPSE
jgi:hypothetical protein